MKNFFISYNHADESWAEWIAWQLEEAGYTTVLQAWDFRPGCNFAHEMDKAIKESERTILVLSPDFLDSKFTTPEWIASFVQDSTSEKGKLLPIKIRECKPEGLLGPINWICLIGLNEENAKSTLLAGISLERAKPDSQPIFPGRRSITEQPRFPGALPNIWNVPHRRNRNFTGRQELLEKLRALLSSGQTVALHGLGGIGKTQIAVEYAYRYVSEYNLVWWIRSEEPAIIAEDFSRLAVDLDLPEKDVMDQTIKIEGVKRWLNKNCGWFLIFDNAEDPMELNSYLPYASIGNVLITSRNPNWGSTAEPLSVLRLERIDSINFLINRTSQGDRNAANSLADDLGDLPLALEQAAAYIEATSTPFSEYLEMFRTRRNELWAEEEKPLDYPETVATTWSLSMQKVSNKAGAGEILNLCAFLAPDGIPIELLTGGAEYLQQILSKIVVDRLAFSQALRILRRYSLIEFDGKILSVHKLVQAVSRDQLDNASRKAWAESAVQLMNAIFPYNPYNAQAWETSSYLLPHALAATGHAEKLDVAADIAGSLLDGIGLYLIRRADFFEAKLALERALEMKERTYGKNHSEVAITCNNLGRALEDLSDLEGAKKSFERALEIDEKVYGINHQVRTPIVNNLAMVLGKLGDLQSARKYLEEAIDNGKKICGPESPEVATMLSNLGTILQDLGDLKGAKISLERAVQIGEKIYGESCHPDFARDLNNLGLVLKDLGDFSRAKNNFERALKIYEKFYGHIHPDTAAATNNLGVVLQDLDDLEGARKSFERALEINEKFFKPGHPIFAKCANNLGNVLRDLGDLKEANKYLNKALEIDEKAYGHDHLQVAIDINNLGNVLLLLGDLEGAKEHYEMALKINEKTCSPKHPYMVTTLNSLGIVLQAMGDLEGARKNLTKGLKIGKKIYGSNHPEVAKTLSNLGMVLKDSGDLEEARENLEQALSIGEKFYKRNHPEMAIMLNNLYIIMQALWKFRK